MAFLKLNQTCRAGMACRWCLVNDELTLHNRPVAWEAAEERVVTAFFQTAGRKSNGGAFTATDDFRCSNHL